MEERPTIDEKEIEDVDISDIFDKKIVVYNDDVNTFNHVINCFIDYCQHTYEQAEQCANIIHYKGKCSVKEGSLDKLKPIKDALCLNKLDAKIE